MRNKKVFTLSLLIVLIFWNQASHSQARKRPNKEDLIKEITTKLYDPTPVKSILKKTGNDLSSGDVLYHQLVNLLSPKDLTPIDLKTANSLFDRAKPKIQRLQTEFRTVLDRETETRSVLVSVEKLKLLVDSLYQLGIQEKRQTGLRIVFGSYEHQANNSDQEKSGRLTVFFVGTIDTSTNLRPPFSFNWRTQKDLTILTKPQLLGYILPSNHGDLCPNNCTDTNTIYKD